RDCGLRRRDLRRPRRAPPAPAAAILGPLLRRHLPQHAGTVGPTIATHVWCMSTQTRHPAGVPVGGRFAPQTHAEADVSLSEAAGVRVDTGSIEVASGSLGRMTIETVPGSPLPPIEIVGDHCHLRPFRSDALHLVEEASRDGFIPLITTVPSEWSPDR